MQTIQLLLQNYKFSEKKSHRTERGDLISYFLEKINPTRTGKYKPFTVSSMAHILSIYNTEELYFLRMKCDKANNFVKTFWWYLHNK